MQNKAENYSYKKIVRAEKTTKNADDIKVVVVGVFAFFVLLLVQHWILPDLIVLDSAVNEVSIQEDN